MTKAKSSSEAKNNADFSGIRYAQCWEDADILLEALTIQPGDVCLSIASAGDNAIAMLTKSPSRVIALDLSPAQLACVELRAAAYQVLEHHELLELIGSKPSTRREAYYQRCRKLLGNDACQFWDNQSQHIQQGIGHAGKFEKYFRLFSRRIMPLIHSQAIISRLLEGGTLEQRELFYRTVWNSWRWRWLFYLFFSRPVMGALGRDPAFFKYVEGSVAHRILDRTRYALTQLNPAENPYLQWILTEQHGNALPLALRPEHFDTIRNNIHRLEWHCMPIEDYLSQVGQKAIHHFNLSDIFEYMSESNYHQLLGKLVDSGIPGGRLAYWNMLVPRTRPESMAHRLKLLDDVSNSLFLQDKTFFYSRFVVEEILP